ncbi:MAG TPA: ElyC/SanA/YdcF family protein [Candidatus Paceibacterota bacterium]|nr:ElyC/SanA/YdcF family protein [Candidatus Paceibacterota bacterium]
MGLETQTACNLAISLQNRFGDTAVILASAGNAGKKWDNRLMSLVIKDYLKSKIPHRPVIALAADAFNTDGEIRALRDYLCTHREFREIVVAVKWWHAPRVWLLMKYRFWEAGIKVKIHIPWCRSFAKPTAWFKEWFGAIPLTLCRLLSELNRKPLQIN